MMLINNIGHNGKSLTFDLFTITSIKEDGNVRVELFNNEDDWHHMMAAYRSRGRKFQAQKITFNDLGDEHTIANWQQEGMLTAEEKIQWGAMKALENPDTFAYAFESLDNGRDVSFGVEKEFEVCPSGNTVKIWSSTDRQFFSLEEAQKKLDDLQANMLGAKAYLRSKNG